MNKDDKMILVVFKDWCSRLGIKEFEGVTKLMDMGLKDE